MKTTVWLALFAACAAPATVSQLPETTPPAEEHPYSFVTSPIRWESPPAQLAKSYDEGYGDIVLIFPRGDISVLSVTFFKDKKSGSIAVCSGCGFSHRKGKWAKSSGSSFLERSQWAYRQGVRLTDLPNVGSIETSWRYEGALPNALAKLSDGRSDYTTLFPIENPETVTAFLRERSD